ncbi:MAG TPA: hypothetical protein VM939_05480, partial [Gemmatimonadaceae bacterium]|nr:hypothetical protein [Gemmatimonadaceae bacterium]
MSVVRYVAIEGIDGSGKTEVVRNAAAALGEAAIGAHVFSYMGRGNTAIGRFLDKHLFGAGSSALGRLLDHLPTVKLLLFQFNAGVNWRRLRRFGSGVTASDPFVLADRSVISAGVLFT